MVAVSVIPARGMAQVAAQPLVGLPLPAIQADASLSATLAMFDQFAGTIVAEVGNRTVTWGDVADAIRAMPAIVSGLPVQQIYQNATVQLMQQKALALAAEEAGLHKTIPAQRRMQNAADDALGHELLRRSLALNTSEASLRAIYRGAVAGKPGPDQVRARIIMVESQEAASGLIQRLRLGADFSALARDFSRDGTATEGGDLGYARLDMLAPELGAVMFALAPGQMTAFPVRSGNYWFIIRVEGRSQQPTPSFDAARTALERDVVHAGVPQLRRQALDNASVTYHGLVGKQAAVQTRK